jgi:predicted nucleic acid-binding protein
VPPHMPPDVGSPREWNRKYYVRITTLEFAAEGTRQRTRVAQLETVLDRGEAEAIALAVERSLDELRQH